MIKLDKYDMKARIFPAFISMLPVFVFVHFFLEPKIASFIDYVFGIKIIGYLTFGYVLTFLFAHICRLISKIYQNIYFKDELFMPTTNYMLYSDKHYSEDFKNEIRQKIDNDFNIKLLSKREELMNETEARKKIVEAMSQIRLKVKSGTLLLKHNIEYGFWRNLIGGSTVAVLISLLNIIFLWGNNTAVILSIGLAVLFLLPVLFSKYIINRLGENYARVLLQEYKSL